MDKVHEAPAGADRDTSAREISRAQESRLNALNSIREAEVTLLSLRGELDDFAFMARDAACDDPVFTRESHFRDVPVKLYELLQTLRCAESELARANRLLDSMAELLQPHAALGR